MNLNIHPRIRGQSAEEEAQIHNQEILLLGFECRACPKSHAELTIDNFGDLPMCEVYLPMLRQISFKISIRDYRSNIKRCLLTSKHVFFSSHY